jgi:hypothetical protein
LEMVVAAVAVLLLQVSVVALVAPLAMVVL